MVNRIKNSLWIILFLIILTSFIPVDRNNPDTHFDTGLPDSVKSVLVQSCYDCHSNETDWPFYSYISPLSFLISHHVEEARSHLNFSLWGIYDNQSRKKKADEILEVLKEGEMPLKSYLWIHRDAKLTKKDVQILNSYFGSLL